MVIALEDNPFLPNILYFFLVGAERWDHGSNTVLIKDHSQCIPQQTTRDFTVLNRHFAEIVAFCIQQGRCREVVAFCSVNHEVQYLY